MSKVRLPSWWPDKYNRQAISSMFNPLFMTFNKFVDGYLATHKALTSDYTVVVGENWFPVDASGGNVTVTLPDADQTKGIRFTVKKTDSSVNTVSVTATQTIDGSASITIVNQYESYDFMSDGTEYFIV